MRSRSWRRRVWSNHSWACSLRLQRRRLHKHKLLHHSRKRSNLSLERRRRRGQMGYCCGTVHNYGYCSNCCWNEMLNRMFMMVSLRNLATNGLEEAMLE